MADTFMKREIIPRGADLTDDDMRLFVEDFYIVRNWAALQMRKGQVVGEEVKDV